MLGRPSPCGSQPCCSSISGRRCPDLGVSWDSWTPEDPFDDVPLEPVLGTTALWGMALDLGYWEVLTAVF